MTDRDACRCRDCRNRDARAFWAAVFVSYTTAELDALYPEKGMWAKLLICQASVQDVVPVQS